MAKIWSAINGAWVLVIDTVAVKTYTDTKWTMWTGTQAQYDAIVTKDSSTLYVVT